MIDHAASSTATSLRHQVRAAIARAWDHAVASGVLPAEPRDGSVPIDVGRPANPEHGDFSTNLALRLAKPLAMPPTAIAKALADALNAEVDAEPDALVREASTAGPGFVNLRLADSALDRVMARVLAEPDGWGRVSSATGRHVNVEFVSANPTGPLTVGNARGAFVGDLLARVLEAGGQRVTREYYFNDSGTQVRNLGLSVIAALDGTPVPEDGYHGDYVADLAKAVPAELLVGSADGDPATAR